MNEVFQHMVQRMRTVIFLFCFSVVLMTLSPVLQAQNRNSWDKILDPQSKFPILIGLYGGINLNNHTGAFTQLDRQTICCVLDNGSGLGGVVGLKAFIPLSADGKLNLSPRIHFEGRGGDFTAASEFRDVRRSDQSVVPGEFQKQLAASLNTFGVDIFGTYTFVQSIGLYGAIGPSFAAVVSSNQVFQETILSPADIDYVPGNTKTIQYASGQLIPVNTLQLSLRAGLGATIKLSNRWSVNPEALYSFPLSKVSSQTDAEWKASAIQLTLGILYSL